MCQNGRIITLPSKYVSSCIDLLHRRRHCRARFSGGDNTILGKAVWTVAFSKTSINNTLQAHDYHRLNREDRSADTYHAKTAPELFSVTRKHGAQWSQTHQFNAIALCQKGYVVASDVLFPSLRLMLDRTSTATLVLRTQRDCTRLSLPIDVPVPRVQQAGRQCPAWGTVAADTNSDQE